MKQHQEKEGFAGGHGVALIFHFETQEDAEKVLERLEAMGGVGPCEGHVWDEEDMVGYVAADAMDGLVISTSAHWHAEDAYADMEEVDQDPNLMVDVFALLPMEMISGERCGAMEVIDE